MIGLRSILPLHWLVSLSSARSLQTPHGMGAARASHPQPLKRTYFLIQGCMLAILKVNSTITSPHVIHKSILLFISV